MFTVEGSSTAHAAHSIRRLTTSSSDVTSASADRAVGAVLVRSVEELAVHAPGNCESLAFSETAAGQHRDREPG